MNILYYDVASLNDLRFTRVILTWVFTVYNIKHIVKCKDLFMKMRHKLLKSGLFLTWLNYEK